MRINTLWSLAVVGLIAACSESTAPGPDQATERFSASKIPFGSEFTCDEPALYVVPQGINAAGDIVGYGAHWEENEGVTHAFLCENKRGVSIDLGNLGQEDTRAYAINASGQVVGSSTTATGERHAFVWDKGVMTDLGKLKGDDGSVANAINDAGQIVGESSGFNPESPPPSRAFLWKKGVMVDLGTLPGRTWASASGINGRGQVVGTSGIISANARINARGFLWQNGRMTPLPKLGGPESYANGINAAGEIVGAAETARGEWHAVLWRAGTLTDLGPGRATAINNSGIVVGFDAEGSAVFWRNGVKVVIEPAENTDTDDAAYFYATAVNARRVVVGERDFEGGSQAFVHAIIRKKVSRP